MKIKYRTFLCSPSSESVWLWWRWSAKLWSLWKKLEKKKPWDTIQNIERDRKRYRQKSTPCFSYTLPWKWLIDHKHNITRRRCIPICKKKDRGRLISWSKLPIYLHMFQLKKIYRYYRKRKLCRIKKNSTYDKAIWTLNINVKQTEKIVWIQYMLSIFQSPINFIALIKCTWQHYSKLIRGQTKMYSFCIGCCVYNNSKNI